MDREDEPLLARLLSLHPKVQTLNLTKRETTIGRSPLCDLVVDRTNLLVSNVHCRIVITQDLAAVTDTSTNGCWLNRKRMGRGITKALRHGDELWITKDAASSLPKTHNIYFVFDDQRHQDTSRVMLIEMQESGVLDEYQFGETLGRGSFGMVVKATHKPSNEQRL